MRCLLYLTVTCQGHDIHHTRNTNLWLSPQEEYVFDSLQKVVNAPTHGGVVPHSRETVFYLYILGGFFWGGGGFGSCICFVFLFLFFVFFFFFFRFDYYFFNFLFFNLYFAKVFEEAPFFPACRIRASKQMEQTQVLTNDFILPLEYKSCKFPWIQFLCFHVGISKEFCQS